MNLVYCLRSEARAAWPKHLPPGYEEEFWRPRGLVLLPRGFFSMRFLTYSLVNMFGGFANSDYGLFLVRSARKVVHHSCINPRDPRFPFMKDDDLQVGDVATAPDHRGRGLAAHALVAIVNRFAKPGRTFWYVTGDDNAASIKAVENAGFARCGTALRRRIAGFFPRYELQRVAE